MHFVYVLQDEKKDKWYIGYTSDSELRMKKHRHLHSTYELVYYESYQDKRQAVLREAKLKHYGSAWRALKTRLRA